MKNIAKSFLGIAAITSLGCAGSKLHAADPVLPLRPDPAGWKLVAELSDEFAGGSVDQTKWDAAPGSWGPWSWDPKSAFLDKGALRLRMVYEPHTRDNQNLFYKSGILRARQEITYGYFEARIKGCRVFPGACPSFWMYSSGHRLGKLRYSEVDFVEMLQTLVPKTDPCVLDCNLHCQVENEKGEAIWIRPKQDPTLCKHIWTAPWDPRDNFHVYGCEVRPKTITWYVDGAKVASAENRYWHLPMKVTLSLGLRSPYERYVQGNRIAVSETSTARGFPTEMQVDYVRTWTREMAE